MAWVDDMLTWLRTDPGVTGIAAQRSAWFERQRGWGDLPAVLLNLDEDGRDYSHGGASGLDRPELVIDCFGKTGSQAWSLGEAVRSMLESPNVTVGGTRFGMGFVRAGRTMGPEDLPDGARMFRRRLIARKFVQNA